jgi:hypothetical protein
MALRPALAPGAAAPRELELVYFMICEYVYHGKRGDAIARKAG